MPPPFAPRPLRKIVMYIGVLLPCFPSRLYFHHIPLPIAHFQAGLRLPLDPAFANFLIFSKVQPEQIRPNTVRTIMSLIVLCRRYRCEMMMKIVRMFFSCLWMLDNNHSLRRLPNRVRLFDSPPNRIEFKGKWVMVESKVGFPFRPLIGKKDTWECLLRDVLLFRAKKRFVAAITLDLGSDPRRQTRVYRMADLLSEESLPWFGIGAGLDF